MKIFNTATQDLCHGCFFFLSSALVAVIYLKLALLKNEERGRVHY